MLKMEMLIIMNFMKETKRKIIQIAHRMAQSKVGT